VLAAVQGLPGFDAARLAADMGTAEVTAAVRRDWAQTRAPSPEVLTVDNPGPHNGRAKPTDTGHRYALPTVVFTGPAGRAVVPGWRDLVEYLAAARRVAPQIRPAPILTRPDEALARYRSLTGPELLTLTGSSDPPGTAVPVATANGPVWLHPDEAATHPALR
jgi:hypothetical protein